MKKTLTIVAVALSLCLAFAAVAGAYTSNVPASTDVVVVKTVTNATTGAAYFMAGVDDTNSAYEKVGEIDYLKVTIGTSLNFRLSLATEPDGHADITDYAWARIRVYNPGANAIGGTVGLNEQINSVLTDNFYLVDLDGAATFQNGYNALSIPAGFDGYVYISLTHWTWQGGSTYTRTLGDTSSIAIPAGKDAYYPNGTPFDPTDVNRANCVWSGTAATDALYFGDMELVKKCFNDVSDRVAPSNINFVLGDSLDNIADAAITAAYAGSGAGSAVINVNNKDKAIDYTATAANSILKFATNGFNAKAANGGTQPWGLAFYVKAVTDVTINHMIAPEGIDHDLYGQGHSYFYDMDGELIAENENGPGIALAAGTEGYYVIQRTDSNYDFSASPFLIWFGIGEAIIDDLGFISAEPGPAATPTPTPTATPTPAPSATATPEPAPAGGAVSMIGFAVAAVVAGAVVVRKKH